MKKEINFLKETATLEEVKTCKCCYNCQHWNADSSLINSYMYNSCKDNDTGKMIMSPAAWCCINFKNKTRRELLENIFGNPS